MYVYLLQVRLTAGASPWSCSIKLQGDAAQRKAGQELERQFAVVTKKEDVELAVRRAQKAALNPSTSPEQFLRWDPPEDPANDNNEHSFTQTVVSGRRKCRLGHYPHQCTPLLWT
jgi:hypothetical protein